MSLLATDKGYVTLDFLFSTSFLISTSGVGERLVSNCSSRFIVFCAFALYGYSAASPLSYIFATSQIGTGCHLIPLLSDVQRNPPVLDRTLSWSKIYNLNPTSSLQMSCILAALEDESISPHMTKDCKEKLKKRKEMWELAARIAPIETFAEIVDSIQSSPNRNYFAGVLFGCLAFIFLFGLLCGRVTKRLHRQVKDR